MENPTIAKLKAEALFNRRKTLEMAVRADSGHVSTAMSQCEILTALYFGGILKYDPKDPEWDGRDIFILSKGQGGIGFYVTLARAGFFPESDLDNFAGPGSTLGVHCEFHTKGVETISGSLGHGLPVGAGFAQAFKTDGKDNKVYVLVGDGELHEGSNWEAMITAAWQKLGNLVVIVDRNNQATLGKLDSRDAPKDGPGIEPLKDKFAAFGWECFELDGHSFPDLLHALDYAKRPRHGQPLCIIANTKKGRGLSVMEDKRNWHYRVPAGKDLDQCWDDLGVGEDRPKAPAVRSQAVHAVGMRDRFFDALFPLFQADKRLVMIAADNGAPTLDKFAAELPGQYLQVGIAEQCAADMAAGMALAGKKPFVYAISPFVGTRIHEFVKLICAMDLPVTFVGVGAGFAYSIMSTTHHCVEDIAIMRALPRMRVWSPADGETAAFVARWSVKDPRPSYVRLDRGGIPDLYQNLEQFGDGFQVPRWDAHATAGVPFTALIATGVMVHRALEVADRIPGLRVIDAFRLKPFDVKTFRELVGGARSLVTLEEHQLAGGLGGIVAETLADNEMIIPLLRIGVNDTFSFELGGRAEIQKARGLDLESIVRRITEWGAGK